jgi:transcriptional regulator with XRE-family HTH domain
MTVDSPPISAAQVRAARAFLELSQEELAKAAKVGRIAIADYERGARVPYDSTLEQIRAVLEAAGVEFLFEGSLGVGIRVLGKQV